MNKMLVDIFDVLRPYPVGVHVQDKSGKVFFLPRTDREGNPLDFNQAVEASFKAPGGCSVEAEIAQNFSHCSAKNLEAVQKFLSVVEHDAVLFADVLPIYVKEASVDSFVDSLQAVGVDPADGHGAKVAMVEQGIETVSSHIPCEVFYLKAKGREEFLVRPVSKDGKSSEFLCKNSYSIPSYFSHLNSEVDPVSPLFSKLVRAKMEDGGLIKESILAKLDINSLVDDAETA